ncbi:MAG: acyl-CoA dehydrogenase family protein [Anaerolineae bacterium]
MEATQTLSIEDIARKLAADFATRADEADKEAKLPEEDVKALKESGYLTMSIPREYGGWGLTLRDWTWRRSWNWQRAAHLRLWWLGCKSTCSGM